ncbi:MAG TPA: integrase core domain-containing protein [Lysobacter sp.]|nr:integrase core domain-containing protein [Lysobacter sp.]
MGQAQAAALAAGRRLHPVRSHHRPHPGPPHARRPPAYATRKPASYQPQQPGDLLQIDTVHITTAEGTQLRPFSAIDVVSRVAAFAVRSRATAGTAAAFLDELLERFPLRIRAIQVDGGSEFRAEFEDACAAVGIPLFELPPRSPKLNGCVERLNRTSREEFWQCYDGDLDLASVTPALRQWEDEYNPVRPHQALQMRAPRAFLATR